MQPIEKQNKRRQAISTFMWNSNQLASYISSDGKLIPIQAEMDSNSSTKTCHT